MRSISSNCAVWAASAPLWADMITVVSSTAFSRIICSSLIPTISFAISAVAFSEEVNADMAVRSGTGILSSISPVALTDVGRSDGAASAAKPAAPSLAHFPKLIRIQRLSMVQGEPSGAPGSDCPAGGVRRQAPPGSASTARDPRPLPRGRSARWCPHPPGAPCPR